jgi:hypothetical protein
VKHQSRDGAVIRLATPEDAAAIGALKALLGERHVGCSRIASWTHPTPSRERRAGTSISLPTQTHIASGSGAQPSPARGAAGPPGRRAAGPPGRRAASLPGQLRPLRPLGPLGPPASLARPGPLLARGASPRSQPSRFPVPGGQWRASAVRSQPMTTPISGKAPSAGSRGLPHRLEALRARYGRPTEFPHPLDLHVHLLRQQLSDSVLRTCGLSYRRRDTGAGGTRGTAPGLGPPGRRSRLFHVKHGDQKCGPPHWVARIGGFWLSTSPVCRRR